MIATKTFFKGVEAWKKETIQKAVRAHICIYSLVHVQKHFRGLGFKWVFGLTSFLCFLVHFLKEAARTLKTNGE